LGFPDFQYPILRIVGCKRAGIAGGKVQAGLSVSYPADRWLQEVFLDAEGSVMRSAFSILSCGSLVASFGSLSGSDKWLGAFSILSCGSLVASFGCWGWKCPKTHLSVSYPADRWLQVCPRKRSRLLISLSLSVSYPADRWLQAQ